MCEMQHIYNYKRTKLWYSKSVLSTVHDSQRPWFFHQSGDRDFGFLLIQINNYHKFNTLVFFLHFGRHSWSFIVVASRDSVERNVEEILISGSWMTSFTCERHEDPPKEWKSQASSYVVYDMRTNGIQKGNGKKLLLWFRQALPYFGKYAHMQFLVFCWEIVCEVSR